ncbi:MAG TPA: excinuclease ABC subunit UvrA [Solirubrobacteraceae bacterium]|nr:excinuclease ABC subunit UvrA [Solirubrobacteraceae bacterium]
MADSHELIRVHGARENNLKDISVELPKRRLTVFTGVSGSGKSSLVFGTIAAESQRLINETYSAFVQGFMPTLARPEVDVLEGLTTAIAVDQERMGGDIRSTVGTATDAGAMLRVLFSRLGRPHVGSPGAFSFNVPSVRAAGAIRVERGGGKTVKATFSRTGGMCPRCEGRGTVSEVDLTQLYDDSKSLSEGALTVPGYKAGGWNYRLYAASGFFDPDKPIRKFTKKELHDLLQHEPARMKIAGINMTYEGLIPRVQKSMLAKDKQAMQPHIRAFVERAVAFATCPECGGSRLSEAARSSRVAGINIAEASAMQVSDLARWVRDLDEPSVAPLLAALGAALGSFVEIGLGYLSLDRSSGTLSGGEAQRVKMVGHLGSALTDVTYVFDEPTVGLHPHDIRRMNELLLRLRDKGNTVLVVEHKPEAIAIADHVVDLGPGAGAAGGEVVFAGSVGDLHASDTLTGRHLDDRVSLKPSPRTPSGRLEIRGADAHNLREVDVDIPLGVLVVLTGVAGSGKSSLIDGSVAGRDGVVSVDQTSIRGSRRSNPATYTGLLEPIRKAFAQANGVKPALFSANSEGACATCNGAGVVYTDLAMMAGVAGICEECEGKRFDASVLEYRLGGRDISEVLAMSVSQATEFFGTGEAGTPAAHAILEQLGEVGLGYVSLGQPLTTLSGGERQRLKLAAQMVEKRAGSADVYVLDEPTAGLHLADVRQLLGMLDRLVDSGKSVIVVEHHQAVMAHADWIVDLGPGAGTTAAGSCSRALLPSLSPLAAPSPGSTSPTTWRLDPKAAWRLDPKTGWSRSLPRVARSRPHAIVDERRKLRLAHPHLLQVQGLREPLEQPLAGAHHDRRQDQGQLVDDPGCERLANDLAAAHDVNVLAGRRLDRLLHRGLHAGHEQELVAFRLLLGPVGDDEEGHAKGIAIPPVACCLVGVAPADDGAHVRRDLRKPVGVIAAGLWAHLIAVAPGATEHPVVQALAIVAEPFAGLVVGACDVTVDRSRYDGEDLGHACLPHLFVGTNALTDRLEPARFIVARWCGRARRSHGLCASSARACSRHASRLCDGDFSVWPLCNVASAQVKKHSAPSEMLKFDAARLSGEPYAGTTRCAMPGRWSR